MLFSQFENLHQMVPPAFAAALMTPPNMKGLMGIPIVHHIPGSNGRGKYKEKLFACPHCGKRYCDASRLKNHVDARHVTKDDQWKDVGPGVDIAVKEPHHPSGFQVNFLSTFPISKHYSPGVQGHHNILNWVATQVSEVQVIIGPQLHFVITKMFFLINVANIFFDPIFCCKYIF